MPDRIIQDATKLTADMVAEYVDILANFRQRMSTREAEAFLGLKHNTIRGACIRKEIEYTQVGNSYRVTPKALAEYVRDNLTVKPDPLPG